MAKEILLYTGIYSYSAANFIRELEDNKGEDICVRGNCGGGSMFDTYGMIAKFKEHPKAKRMVARYADKRAALKAAGNFEALDKLPKNSSAVRMRNRCKLSGRPRGYIRQFGVSRNFFREMALDGKIPGVTKSSW